MASLLLAALLAAAPATAPATTPADPGSKIRCKREVETGSLVKATKVCHTVAEWDAMRREARDTTTQIQTTVPGQTN